MLSIIIATHKRATTLHTCLQHLAKQTIAKQLEVIIVSDGPDPATKKVALEPWNLEIHYSSIKKAQQGVARNKGIKLATGEWCMLINDDIFLQPTVCALHLNALEALNTEDQQAAILGFTTWDPSLQINKTMRFLEATGWQFGYPLLQKHSHNFIPKNVQANFTYSSHISLPTAIAKNYPFTATKQYGWEDIEWGEQLKNAKIGLWYEPDAIGHHHHFINLEQSLKRASTIGKSLAYLEKHHPTFRRSATGLKLLKQKAEALLPTLAGKHRKAFLEGFTTKK